MNTCFTIDGDPGEIELISDVTAAIGLTATTYAPTSGLFKGMQARSVLIQIIGASANVTLNGTTPTITAGTDKGLTLTAGTNMVVSNPNAVINMKFINAVAAAAGTVKIKAQPFF